MSASVHSSESVPEGYAQYMYRLRGSDVSATRTEEILDRLSPPLAAAFENNGLLVSATEGREAALAVSLSSLLGKAAGSPRRTTLIFSPRPLSEAAVARAVVRELAADTSEVAIARLADVAVSAAKAGRSPSHREVEDALNPPKRPDVKIEPSIFGMKFRLDQAITWIIRRLRRR